MINGFQMAAGGLGALVATTPVEAALQITDWRGIFSFLGFFTLMATSAMAQPDPKPTSSETQPQTQTTNSNTNRPVGKPYCTKPGKGQAATRGNRGKCSKPYQGKHPRPNRANANRGSQQGQRVHNQQSGKAKCSRTSQRRHATVQSQELRRRRGTERGNGR